MVVSEQSGHMRPAGLALRRIGQHHDMGDGEGGGHGLRRAGVDFVVQQDPVRVLGGADRRWHANP